MSGKQVKAQEQLHTISPAGLMGGRHLPRKEQRSAGGERSRSGGLGRWGRSLWLQGRGPYVARRAPGVPAQHLGGIDPTGEDELDREAVLGLHALDVRRVIVASAGIPVLMLLDNLVDRPVMRGRKPIRADRRAGEANHDQHQEHKQPPYGQAHSRHAIPSRNAGHGPERIFNQPHPW